jgi:CubicO group peptidase (beta-lactamase class C family)
MTRTVLGWSVILVVCAAPAAVRGQPAAGKTLPAAMAKAVDAAVAAEMTKQQAVGVAIGVIQDGRVVYLKGYGLADRENKTPVTTDTVFNWASNSKPLTAVAVMRLVEKKQLDLDADVRKYVPEFPDKDAVITVRHLLCHQSGLPHYSNGKVVPTRRTYKTDQPFLDPVNALDRFNLSPLLFKPGEKADYSSYAYLLLSAAVQKAGKEPFDRQIQEYVAKPLGLKSLQLDVEFKSQPNWAAGYVKDKQDKVVPAGEEAHYWIHGGGAYKSSVQDFARWAQALVNHELVSKESEKQMWTPQKTADGKATKWGLGFEVDDQGGLRVSHNGSHREVATRMVLYPRARDGVVVMCNCQFASPGAFTTAVLAALRGK